MGNGPVPGEGHALGSAKLCSQSLCLTGFGHLALCPCRCVPSTGPVPIGFRLLYLGYSLQGGRGTLKSFSPCERHSSVSLSTHVLSVVWQQLLCPQTGALSPGCPHELCTTSHPQHLPLLVYSKDTALSSKGHCYFKAVAKYVSD